LVTGENSESMGMTPMGRSVAECWSAGDVAAAAVDLDLHAQVAVTVQRGDVQVLVQHLDLGVHLEVPGAHLALAAHLEHALLRAVAEQLQPHLLQIENDLGDVLDHARQRRELVQHALDAHRRDRRALQRRQQHPPQRVAERGAEAALERVEREPAIAVGVRGVCDQTLRHLEILPLHLQASRIGKAIVTSSRARRSAVR
jgi:hypothetical protein